MSHTTIGHLRVALIITELGVGGAERSITNLAIGLDRKRFVPTVVSLAPPPSTNHDLFVEQLAASDVPVEFLGLRSPWQYLRGVRALRHRLTQIAPDVIQSFLFHANVLTAQAASRINTSHVTGVRVADPSRWRAWLERIATRRVDKIACVSQSVAEHCQYFSDFAAEKLCVIRNGIDLTTLQNVKAINLETLGLRPGRKAVVFAGRLHPQKSVPWLLQAAARFLCRLPDYDLIVAGDGPQRTSLENQARELNIANQVHFVGYRSDLLEVLAASQMVVLASRWEGMPNVLMEAMALAKPIVAIRAEGVSELLHDTDPTQLVHTHDVEAFAECVMRIAQDPILAKSIGQQNRQRIQQHFSLRTTINAYEQLYLSVAKHNASR
ncbi:MAG: hypothetical protein CMJ75_11900 [Planctomycetaceae bacterium]|nr:hypothetical protein [Planctomycetaceae bacterium]